VTLWLWVVVGVVGAILGTWLVLVLALLALNRRGDVRDVTAFIPDCIILFRRLAGDRRVPRSAKAAMGLLIAYLAMPFDLVPDFIPIAGQLDDAILVALTMAYVTRKAGQDVVAQLWPGSPRGLTILLKLASPAPRFW
jgi:uncharacterized membrane protein YkvA (DUF1232 family)